jgi:hypothetical protein
MTFADLPAVNASLNGLSAVLLGFGYYFVKRDKLIAHRNRHGESGVARTV